MRNYDFALTREDAGSYVYTGSIVRRYIASMIDVLIVGFVIIKFGVITNLDIESESEIGGLFNLALLFMCTFVPEFMFRQSVGMYLCGLVVVVPHSENPKTALLIRKLMNLVEFVMPSCVYFFLGSLRDGSRSLSDECSKCLVVRKKYLINGIQNIREPGRLQKYIVPLVFSLIPILTILLAMSIFLLVFQWDGIWDLIRDLPRSTEMGQ